MKEIEIISKRKPREKHFLRDDGCIVAKIYSDDIHYLKNGKYEEIDNTLVETDGIIQNKSNDFTVKFNDNNNYLMQIEKENYYLNVKLENSNNITNTEKVKISKYTSNVIYKNVKDNTDIEYKTLPNRVKETIILKDNQKSFFTFRVETNLDLFIEDGCIVAKNNSDIVFTIDKPFMEDSNSVRNDNVFYNLRKIENNYELNLILDKEWLDNEKTKYPVYVDPTITNNSQSINLYDTYIYPGDNNDNRSTREYLKAGVEKVNGSNRVNRTLIKFDLPDIGTGSEIVYASLYLTPYYTNTEYPPDRVATIHRVTSNWDESSANWNNMNDKYEERVESMFYGSRSPIIDNLITPSIPYYDGNITNLVKKWYRNTPNYGVMIKCLDESKYIDDDYPMFYSKDNNFSSDSNPKPVVTLIYRNQSGIEKYLDYKIQELTNGAVYENTYNGNLTTVFDVGHTIGGNMSVNLDLVYNTNDVILKNSTKFGVGYKLSLEQTIREVTISDTNYLEYIDETGTTHYFIIDPENNIYVDEDGLNFKIEKTDTLCTLTDNDSNKMEFTKITDRYYLTKIMDSDSNYIVITLNDDNSINKITDSFNNQVSITYDSNIISIVSPDSTVTLNYQNGLLTSISTIDGITSIEYNSKMVIQSITDTTGIKYNYEYYSNIPYRIASVEQIGLNSEVGESFSLEYGFDTTNISDNKGRKYTLIFNEYGNVISRNSLIDNEDINNAYSIVKTYGNNETNKNKILSEDIPIKFVKNYLKNSSFEYDDEYFITSSGIIKTYSTDDVASGNRSLKIESTSPNQYIEQTLTVDKGKYYTFSGYFKNNNKIIISLSYEDSNNHQVIEEQEVEISDTFKREDVTIYYDNNAVSDLKIKISMSVIGIVFVDDIQLEEGETANEYNIIENSDFSEGYNDWTLNAWSYDGSSVTPENFFSLERFNNNKNTALKINADPAHGIGFSKELPIKGKAGDLYTISFWYKNEGFPGYGPIAGSTVMIYFKPIGHDAEYCILSSDNLNTSEDKWQYFTYKSHATEDFEYVRIVFTIGREANAFYLTNLSFYKNVTSGDYNYDENGNLISITDQSNNTKLFNYDSNNQLISATNPLGKEFKYEYDNEKKSRVLCATSSSGYSNKIIYDENGNPISSRISKKMKKNIDDGEYKIRSKGTNKYIKAELNAVMLEENDCSNTIWKLEKIGEYYKIIYSMVPEYSISCVNGILTLDTSDSNNLFKLEKNDNGSYHIMYYEETSDGTVVRFLTNNDGLLVTDTWNDNSTKFEFYIEIIENLFLENDATYTQDARFLSSVITDNFNKIEYEIDSTKGLIKSTKNAEGTETKYTYNDQNQITSITCGNKTLMYNYNDKKLLSKIIEGETQYNIEYNNFLNISSIKIGDDINLINNDYYVNNGQLKSCTYGNNDVISYIYDEFDRIKTISKMYNTYNYKYDNNGNLSKIISNDSLLKYKYDIANRVIEVKNGDFKINYVYDANNNITQKMYKLGTYENIENTVLDEEEVVKKMTFDNQEINYEFDNLNRLISKSINDSYNINFDYISYGNRSTSLIKKVINGADVISYTYNKLNNITSIYHNNILTNKYNYNEYGELINEIDYANNQEIDYIYDLYGNIITKSTKNLTSSENISTNEYLYGNSLWKDQLTKFNGESINYDNIGNPISIGNNITLTWQNGQELRSYINTQNGLTTSYTYDQYGIRNKKEINGITTEYYLLGNLIIYEKTNEDVIYYIRENDNLIGFKYNNEIYYYIKNAQQDIIGILDSNCNKIVEYKYDSWGKLLEMIDISNNNIGTINPFRYRSYYYDNETGFYYLNSRYYNPIWGRFINADSYISIDGEHLGHNLYTYCSNDPINNVDNNGTTLKAIVKWIKKKVQQIKKAISKVVSPKQTKKSSASIVQKTSTKSTTSKKTTKNTASKSKSSFVAEFGVGVGGGAEFESIGIETYQDKTYGFNSKSGTYSNISGSLGVGIGVLGTSYDYTHEYPFDKDEPGWKHTSYDTQVIPNCENTQHSRTDKFLIFYKNTDGTSFIGLDIGVHMILGGHIKIGFEF